jgi:hypothetical protein
MLPHSFVMSTWEVCLIAFFLVGIDKNVSRICVKYVITADVAYDYFHQSVTDLYKKSLAKPVKHEIKTFHYIRKNYYVNLIYVVLNFKIFIY